MLCRTLIRKWTNATTYTRGMDIYLMNGIEEFVVEEGEGFDYIKAEVEGSELNRYEIGIVYDIEKSSIEDVYCQCQAFSSYNGICKHCVAVLLEYINYLKRMDAILEGATYKSQFNAIPHKKIQTTPSMKQLLSKNLMKRTLPMIQGSEYGKVRIEPLLTCDRRSIQVEFKIGVTQMYVLKDIFTFIKALQNNEDYYYGQKLRFLHTIEAFDLEYRPLVKCIQNWVQRNKAGYLQSSYNGYSYGHSMTKLRSIPLTNGDLEELIDAIGNRPCIANVNGTGEKAWQPTDEEPPREMVISRKNDGIEVKINYLSGHQGNHENIYFENGKIYRVSHKKLEPILDFLRCMSAIPERTVYINNDDIPSFCRELLPVLERYFICEKVDFDEKKYGVLPVSYEIYLDAPQKDFITCKLMAVYGDKKYNIFRNSNMEDAHLRDMVHELEVGNIVSSFCNTYDKNEQLMVVAEDDEKIYELLVNGIPRMQEMADVYISDALRRLKVTPAPKVEVGVSISGDLLELSLTSDDMSKEQLIEILLKYDKKKKFYRLKNGNFVNVEGEEIEALIELKQGLHLSESQLKQSTIEIPKYRTLYLDAELKEKNSLSVNKNKEFKALVRNMKTVEDNDFDLPKGMEDVLREYQKRGFLWIKTLKHNGFGGILADDMGLGKTLQVISYLLSEYLEADSNDNRSALIICPASLVFNWKSEIEKFAPGLNVKMVIGTAGERQEIIQNIGEKDILVTSYDLLKRDMDHYEKITFHCQIIDEAQYIKNHNTQAAKAVKAVNAGFKLALTGTPIENRLSELWSIFDYLMPGFLYTYKRFREELEIPIVQNQEEKAVRRLQKMITPFVLRRLKKDVLTDLPDKMEENIFARLEGEQQKLYNAHVKKLQIMLGKQTDEEFKNSKIQILSELTKLRQVCCDPSLLYEDYYEGSAKIEMCMELIHNALSGGHKILLFSQFTSLLENIQKRLKKENIRFYTLTGATSKENRAKLVENFNKDDTPIFCISLKAGGTGLNLTSADIVIHFDPWWNLAVQNQATDRAHRIGQKNVVSVYKLIVKGTIEENIMKIQDKKKELAEQVLSGEGMNGGSFTRNELMDLLTSI